MPSFVASAVEWLAGTHFSQLMTASKWWWAFLMDMHFLGLVLLVGAVGVFDLRVLGFARQLPLGRLNKLLPWAIAGFCINLLTGTLAFIGMPEDYTYNVAFLLKMLFIALAGVNVLLFYVTNASRECRAVAAGGNAPILAKCIAGASLFLWFGVIVLGRYIQQFTNSISH